MQETVNTFGRLLSRAARLWPTRAAVIFPDSGQSFAELEERAQSAQVESQIGERQRQVAELEQKVLTAASDAAAYPTLSQYAATAPSSSK